MPCFPGMLQAPVKGFLRPGVWMPCARDFHQHVESWKIDDDPTHCLEEILIATENLNEVEHPTEFYVNKVRYDDSWVQIFCYTPAGWLDVMEIDLCKYGENMSLAKVVSFSTGLLPAWLPFGFLCDMALCWCPFRDNGSNEMRCQSLREVLPFNVQVLDNREDERLLPKATNQRGRSSKYREETRKNK
ncbi:uncharacterized protein LOC143446401 [Clavelina lepadiformis]|uniref:uncharacterized protein LOC143446401 n=1 Tax=Clavelina lepadiformis TaxID=159417 RepID=UPI004041AD95